MAREILFRGKTAGSGRWIYGTPVYYKSGEVSIYNDECPQYGYEGTRVASMRSKVISESVGQFTGLLDKNGNKIFEGDILTSTFGSGDPYCIHFGSYDCDGENMIGWYCYPDNTSFGLTIEGNTNAYEVIGNIHDNPELIGRETYNG